MRALPDSLTSVLRHARWLEKHADDQGQERRAIAATSAIMLAAVQAGWQINEIAASLGMFRSTVKRRVEVARVTYQGTRPALLVDRPLGRAPTAYDIVAAARPTERAWLTVTAASDYVYQSRATIRNWDVRGALPNTDRRSPGLYLYLRADLDRVVDGPRRGVYPDFDRLLERIAAAPV